MKTLRRDRVLYEFDAHNQPVLEVKSGERFLVQTADCYGGAIRRAGESQIEVASLPSRRNPVTGPIYVHGAEPGGVLSVRIHRIAVAAEGVSTVLPGRGPLGESVARPLACFARVRRKSVRILGRFSLPLRKMVGVIGVAPQGGAVSTRYPGPHGGNLDTGTIGEGSTVHLPIFARGALLCLGDVHAAMGDGEICGTGVEVDASVVLTTRLASHDGCGVPVVETRDAFYLLASATTVDEAARLATQASVRLVRQQCSLAFEEACMLVGQAGDLQISQIVNPLSTVRMRLPSSLLRF